METTSFNLVTEPWIQVLDQEGQLKNVSLLEVFENAPDYQRLAGDMESQDLTILRLLIAVLTTVYSRVNENDKPYEWLSLNERFQVVKIDEDVKDQYYDLINTWHALYKKGNFSQAISQYLKAHIDKFNFLGKDPFYQVNKEIYNQEVPANKKVDLKKLIGTVDVKQINRTVSESNNSLAIFSPKTPNTKNLVSLPQLIRWIIMYQSFTGVTDKTKVTSKEKFSVSAGWLYGLNPVFAQGKNLFQTLMLNLVFSKDYKIEKPVWEFKDSVEYIDFLKKQPLSSELPISTIYTLWSRMLHIEWVDEKPIIFTAGLPKLDSANAFIEPMTTWRHKGKPGNFHPATKHLNDMSKAMWRNFGEYVATFSETDPQKAAEVHEPGLIQWLKEIQNNNFLPTDISLTLKTATLISDGNTASQLPVAEIVDSFKIKANVLFDNDKKYYWPKNIEDTIEMTQQVGKDFWDFVNSVSKLRGLGGTEFANNLTASFYEKLNLPFLNWLAGLRNDQKRDPQIKEWKNILSKIVMSEADSVMNHASSRDIIGVIDQDSNNQLNNIFISFNRFKFRITQHIKG